MTFFREYATLSLGDEEYDCIGNDSFGCGPCHGCLCGFGLQGSCHREGKNKTYSFEVKDGSITENKLQPNFLADVKTESEKAQVSSSSASESATSANTFAQQAKQYRDETEQIKNDVKSIVNVDIATTEKAGIVKPDGTTITVDVDGTIHSVGGSGGTKDYSELSNKPKINGVELSGNKTNSDLVINAKSIGADVSGSASQALSDANSYTNEKVNEVINNLPTELDSYEEIMANTQTKKSAGALGVKEGFEKLNDSLQTLGGFTPVIDSTTGEITGYKTTIGGADTVFPFSSSDYNVLGFYCDASKTNTVTIPSGTKTIVACPANTNSRTSNITGFTYQLLSNVGESVTLEAQDIYSGASFSESTITWETETTVSISRTGTANRVLLIQFG